MSNQHYPDAPGYQHTDTSIAAADSVASSAPRLQAMVLTAIRDAGDRGMTTNEIAEHLMIDKGTVQPRTSELRQKGDIRDSGARRANDSGRRAIVWVSQ